MTKEEKLFEAIGEISEERLAESEEAEPGAEKESLPDTKSEAEKESLSDTKPQKKIIKFSKYSDTIEKVVCACAVLCLLIVAGRRFLPGLFGSGSSSVATENAASYDSASSESEMNEAAAEDGISDKAAADSGTGEYLCSIDPAEAAMISISGEGETVQITGSKQVQKYVEAWNQVEIEVLDADAIAEGIYTVTICDDSGEELFKFAMDSAEGSEAYTVLSGDLCFDKIETMLK